MPISHTGNIYSAFPILWLSDVCLRIRKDELFLIYFSRDNNNVSHLITFTVRMKFNIIEP